MSLFRERKSCPLCACTNHEVLYHTDYKNSDFVAFLKLEETYRDAFFRDFATGIFDDETFTVVKCNRCRFIYLKRVLNADAMIRLYDDWIDAEVALHLHKSRDHAQLAEYFSRVLNLIVSNFGHTRPINVLDWGAGFGFFCQLARSYGLNVFALDLSDKRRAYLKELRIPTMKFDELQDRYYHFINLDQVIEHEAEPLVLLKKVYSALRANGILRISAPNCSTIGQLLKAGTLSRETFDQISPHQHINAFTNRTLKKVCQTGGFEILLEMNPKSMLLGSVADLQRMMKLLIFNLLQPFYYRFHHTTLFLKKINR